MSYHNDELPRGCRTAVACGVVFFVASTLLASFLVRMYEWETVYKYLVHFARTWAFWPAIITAASLCVQTLRSDSSTDAFSRGAAGFTITVLVGLVAIFIGVWCMGVNACVSGDIVALYDGRIAAARAWKEGRTEEAAVLFERLVQKKPTNMECLLGLGTVRFALKDYQRAAASFESAVRVESNNVDALSGLSLSLEASGRNKEAIGRLHDLLQVAPYWQKEAIETKISEMQEKGQQDESTVPVEAAPSASSTVR